MLLEIERFLVYIYKEKTGKKINLSFKLKSIPNESYVTISFRYEGVKFYVGG